MKLANALLAALLLGPPVAIGQVRQALAPVTTSSGSVAGAVLPSGVKTWLGIPYAQPPVQARRWQAPQPLRWTGTWNADRRMPECIQILRPHDINHYFGEEATSEDCLYLNIWAPGGASARSRLPVIVYLYGGGFTIGSSGIPLYAGEPLARHGAVVVNFNYRVGILGFMAHPELTREQGGHSGNYGFLDQVAALKWVHDNIARFGGDPSHVLLAGQSAGASSVSAQIFSPLARGLFQAAFMSSACNWSAEVAPLEAGEATGTQIQRMLGAATLTDMRAVPADRILALQAENQLMTSNQGVRATAVIDGYFTPKPYLQMLQAHENSDVPIIATSNADDIDVVGNALVAATNAIDYRRAAETLYGTEASRFLELYPAAADADVRAVAARAARDAGMQGSARKCAQLQSQYNRSPAYISLFTHRQPFMADVKIADMNPASAGAYHTADIGYWLGTLDALNQVRATRSWQPRDRQLAEDMMQSLVAFARTGSPATTAVPWPAWSASAEQRMVFGEQIHAETLDTNSMNWLSAHPPRTVETIRPRARD